MSRAAHLTRSLAIAALLLCLSGCTIIRYVDGDEPEPPPGGTPEPRVVDVLIMVELNRSTVALAPGYEQIIGGLGVALATQNITVRQAALAPMYQRTGAAVPLIYGTLDPNSEFESFEEAIAFFANDDGQRYLRDQVDADGENLATLGLELDTRPLYHPRTSDPVAQPYFLEPADGLIVVSLTARARACNYSDAACQLNGQAPAEYFSATDEQGQAAWLQLGGRESLSPKRVFFLSIATDEQVSQDDFVNTCTGKPGFPSAMLDHMEPSDKPYYRPLTTELGQRQVPAQFIDMCTALSPIASVPALASVAGAVRQMVR